MACAKGLVTMMGKIQLIGRQVLEWETGRQPWKKGNETVWSCPVQGTWNWFNKDVIIRCNVMWPHWLTMAIPPIPVTDVKWIPHDHSVLLDSYQLSCWLCLLEVGSKGCKWWLCDPGTLQCCNCKLVVKHQNRNLVTTRLLDDSN